MDDSTLHSFVLEAMRVKGLGRGGSVIDVGGGGGAMASTQPIPAAGPSQMDVDEEDGGQVEPQEESLDHVAASVLTRLRSGENSARFARLGHKNIVGIARTLAAMSKPAGVDDVHKAVIDMEDA